MTVPLDGLVQKRVHTVVKVFRAEISREQTAFVYIKTNDNGTAAELHDTNMLRNAIEELDDYDWDTSPHPDIYGVHELKGEKELAQAEHYKVYEMPGWDDGLPEPP